MGRFDLLTQLDKKPINAASLAENSTPITPTPPSEKQSASKSASKQTSEEANQQGSLPSNLQISKLASKQASLPANQQTSKTLKKFGSYLTEESLKALKRIAFETDRKDYEVLQVAVDQYLQRSKK